MNKYEEDGDKGEEHPTLKICLGKQLPQVGWRGCNVLKSYLSSMCVSGWVVVSVGMIDREREQRKRGIYKGEY